MLPVALLFQRTPHGRLQQSVGSLAESSVDVLPLMEDPTAMRYFLHRRTSKANFSMESGEFRKKNAPNREIRSPGLCRS